MSQMRNETTHILLEPRAFTKEAISTAKSICGRHLRSIYLFGGLAQGHFSRDVSDVDLLFVVEDDCPYEVIEELEHGLIDLEIKYGFLKTNSGDKLLYIFALRSALFRSHFVLRQRSLRTMDLHALFREGRGFDFPFGKILFPLAPAKLVARNVFLGREMLYGDDVIERSSLPLPSFLDFHRSLVMSVVISVFGIVASIIFRVGTRFSLEAVKWYILNIYAFLEGKTPNIKSAMQYIVSKESLFSPLVIDKFLELRKSYSRDIFFSFTSLFYLLYVHLVLVAKLSKDTFISPAEMLLRVNK